MKKYRLNLKRIMSNILIIILFIILINIFSNYTLGNKHIETKAIIVNNNDTLWSLAANICESSTEQLNIQNVVLEIKTLNNLQNSVIYTGQELSLPIYN